MAGFLASNHTIDIQLVFDRKRPLPWPFVHLALRSGDDVELADLLSKSAHGDELAFAELYDRTRHRTFAMIISVLHAPDHAAEVMQELYVSAWRDATRYDWSKGSVTAWLVMMARRRAIDRTRSVDREITRDHRYAENTTVTEIDEVWECVETGLRANWVRDALESLRTGQRDALTMAYFGGYSQAQIATILGLPLGTVKTRIRDGLGALRRTMAVAQ
jgi:RNA polymerase sigma-70 factor (ECF subfamily)